ncbi:MAG: DUF1361 domain-containing protein [Verrucomicrobiota bacterium]
MFWTLIALVAAAGLCVSLSAVRVFYSARFTHANLVWNLFLACIPVGFSLLAWRYKNSKIRLLICGACWLLFLPNAPYLVTDLVHLKSRPPVPFWFDIILFQSFICLGLLLTFLSLYWMQNLITHISNRRIGWMFTLFVVGLTGFGLYLGRVQRWNSWDLFVHPVNLVSDAFQLLLRPRRRVTGLYSILYGGFLLIAYSFFYALIQLPTQFSSPKVDDPLKSL